MHLDRDDLICGAMKLISSTGLASCKAGGDGAFLGAHFATFLVAMQKNVVGTGVAQHVEAGVTGDLFGAVAPEHDFLSAESRTLTPICSRIEDFAVGLGILKRLAWARTNAC
jgi:hypothetical protein